MRKAESAKRATTKKAKAVTKTVEQYLAAVPQQARANLKKLRATIRSAVPAEATETISYGIPAFKHKKVIVWFAAFANHCSLFPTASVIESFKNELKSLSTSKGTIHFPNDEPLPTALVKKIVKARVAQSNP